LSVTSTLKHLLSIGLAIQECVEGKIQLSYNYNKRFI